jgi:Protein of unknown function (DUF1116)
MNPLPFSGQLQVFNVGVAQFGETAALSPNATVHHLDWRPPINGSADTATINARLLANETITAANAMALQAFLATEAVVVDVQPAASVIESFHNGQCLLHAGPPIAWHDMCGPMRGALIGAAMFEGWAADAQGAEQLLASGSVKLEPCHHSRAVGPMSGVISPSMPVWIVEDQNDTGSQKRSFSNLNEGLGKVLRFGAHDQSVLDRLVWMRDELGPILGQAVRALGGVALRPIMAQALHMGDEVHNRNVAATGQFLKRIASAIAETSTPSSAHVRVLQFIGTNDHFFLNLSMAACKLMLDSAKGFPGSSMVTAMARNGVNFGIQVSGLGDQWFEAPAATINGLYFSGYSPADANPDLGDSAITETAGIGGFAMAAAPAIVGFVGGTVEDALAHTQRMRQICIGENPSFTIPSLGFQAAGAGIDIRSVVDSGILPVINTGIAHREAGIGQIGAGITNAPFACFATAAQALEASFHPVMLADKP